MAQEPGSAGLEALTEEIAQQIIFICQPGATSDLLTAVKQLLSSYLDLAHDQLAQDALRQHWIAQQDQQN